MKLKIKTGDNVVVTAGKDKGKRGKVMRVIPEKQRVVVEGVNVVTKHNKPTRQNQRGGIERKEAPIHLSTSCWPTPKRASPPACASRSSRAAKRCAWRSSPASKSTAK